MQLKSLFLQHGSRVHRKRGLPILLTIARASVTVNNHSSACESIIEIIHAFWLPMKGSQPLFGFCHPPSICFSAEDPKKYNSLHFLRALNFALGGRMVQTEDQWSLLRAMGGGASEGARHYGVYAYQQAQECASQSHISQLQGEDDSLEDLVCFCCLAKQLAL